MFANSAAKALPGPQSGPPLGAAVDPEARRAPLRLVASAAQPQLDAPQPAVHGRGVQRAIAAGALLVALFASNFGMQAGGALEFLALHLPIRDLLLITAFVACWPYLLSLSRLELSRTGWWDGEVTRIIAGCALGGLLLYGTVSLSTSELVRPGVALWFWLFATAGTLSIHGVTRITAAPARVRQPRRVIIVGTGLRALRLWREISADPRAEYEVLGFIDSTDEIAFQEVERRLLGRLEDLESILMRQVVDEVLIALPIRSCYNKIQNVIRTCELAGVESKYLADVFQCSLARPRYEATSSTPLVALKVACDDYRLKIKRLIDIWGALVGLIVLAPLFLVIAGLIKATSPGPVFFVQRRYGYRKRLFPMYKFRTMVVDAEQRQAELEELNEAGGPVFKIRDDPRVTRVGKILRKFSLDELPQLFNVLRGDMSLVGPRPLPVRDVQLFEEAWLMRRFSVRPGLTCLWQIGGRSNLGFDDWVTLDLRYIDTWSLGLDFQILARTFPAVVRGVGAA